MKRFLRARWGLLLGILVAPSSAASGADRPPAPDPTLRLGDYVRASWARDSGLPQNTVHAIAQTPDGYVWLATEDGLARFDGVRFVVFNAANTPALGSNFVRALHVDPGGRLWVGTTHALARREGGAFVAVEVAGLLPPGVVSALHVDRAGALWIGTQGSGLGRLASGRLTILATAEGLAGNDVTALAEADDGAMWVATHSGLSRVGGDRIRSWGAADGLPSADVRVVRSGRDGSVWIGTAGGLVSFHDGAFRGHPLGGDRDELVREILEDGAGTLWVGTVEGGLVRQVGGRLERLGPSDGLADADVRALLIDREGGLWVGTNTRGAQRLSNPRIRVHGVPEGMSHDVALGVLADRQGTLWVATYGGGLNRRQGRRWTTFTTAEGLATNVVVSLAEAGAGGLWVGTRAGLHHFDGRGFRHLGPAEGLDEEPVLALLEGGDGALWLGTRSGLKRWRPDGVVSYSTADGLGSDIVLSLLERRDGSLWVGTEGGGVSRLSDGAITTFSRADGLPSDIVLTLTEDRDGDLWLGTNGGGLVLYREGRFRAFTSADGLYEDWVGRVLDDGGGSLWLSGLRGISRVRKESLVAFAAGRLERVPVALYDEADGMRSAECNGGFQPAGWRTADGRMWFPTMQGVAVVDPARLAAPEATLSPIVEEVTAGHGAAGPAVPTTLPPGVRDVEIRYTAPTFQVPERLTFRYRLEGFDREWVEAGTRRVAYYTNLQPGSYRFQVAARRQGQAWLGSAVTLPIQVVPLWHERQALRVAAAAAVVLLGLAVFRWRVGALRARQHELAALVAAREEALEALGQSERRYRELFEHLWEGVYQTSPDGRMLLANPALARMLGYGSVAELMRQSVVSLYHDPSERERLAAELTAAGEVHDRQVTLQRRDGSTVTVLLNVREVRDAKRAALYWEGTVFDITGRERLEQQVRQLQKMETVGRLAGSVAHDFNNLLTPILGHSQLLLLESRAIPAVADAAEEIHKAAESAAALTRQLLAVSRHEAAQPRVLDLNEVVRGMEKLLVRLLGEKIAVRLALDPATGRVRADQGQIEQILLNLAVNARDAMPGGGTISIGTERVPGDPAREQGELSALWVEDTGEGIPGEVRDKLFEPFFTTKPQGTGLGLATVAEVVASNHGSVTVESEPGKGAVFRVLLPVVQEEIGRQIPSSPVVPTGDRETILVVEDHESVRTLAERVLAAAGFRVLAAGSGEEAVALEEHSADAIDLLLTDVGLPGMSGCELAEQLLARRPGLRVLYMTGYAGEELERRGLLDSAPVLLKPFTAAGLAAKVSEALAATPVARPHPRPLAGPGDEPG
ncbi:MAG TPA: two-component regulator propeller domain-containing protein [Thermoanaerobaculia bacterium]|nr:two-component regulator propeller domain-containing protein [Thermoanaerobaculia bacterium]